MSQYTGVIYGFLRKLLYLSETMQSNQFIFAWDSKREDCVRRALYAGYKDRPNPVKGDDDKEKWERSYKQFSQLQHTVLPALGFRNSFQLKGFEADDIIATITKTYYPEDWGGFVIVSSDEDLYQLLDDCAMYLLSKKKFYTRTHLFEEYGITPTDWGRVKTIAGCSSDVVPGIEGVGAKTAAKFLAGKMKLDSVKYNKIADPANAELFERNEKLVVLPHADCPDVELIDFRDEDLAGADAISVFKQFGFKSLINGKEWTRWSKMINLPR